MEKDQPEKVDVAVKSRITLLDTAKKVGIEVKDEMTDQEIKKAVILKAYPKSDEVEMKAFTEMLEKKDEVYINARFDGAVEYLEDRTDIQEANREKISDISDSKTGKPINADDAREKMKERMINPKSEEKK